MIRTARFALALGFVLVFAAPAFAHGEETRSVPVSGADLRNAPEEVRVALSERPARDASMQITDGCGEEVSRTLAVVEDEIVARVSGGSPGRWRITWAAISSLDGHNTRGSITFRVAGAEDCPARADESVSARPALRAEAPREPRLPIVAALLGFVGIVGAAAAIRITGAR